MLQDLIQALVNSRNEAADDVLLEALARGNEAEKNLALSALLRRRTLHGLCGVVAQYNNLPAAGQMSILQSIRLFHHALRECGRSKDQQMRLAALKLIALGRQGRLTYVLSEALHGADEQVARAACEAMVALARWVSTETRRLHAMKDLAGEKLVAGQSGESFTEAHLASREVLDQRDEIEQAVARALEVHRGKFGPDLLRAALLLADSPLSKTLAILQTPKHGGQAAMIRRLQQPPDSEHVEAFLLAASRHGLRSNFGVVFAHIAEPPVLDALLRRTHWLKDHALSVCMQQVTRGPWWAESELTKDLSRRDDEDAARVGQWVAASGVHDVLQDALLARIHAQLDKHVAGRLRLLRLAMARPAGASSALLRTMLSDPDERLARLAVRELVRRRAPDFDNALIGVMASSPQSVRKIISRSVGQVGFESFWDRFDRLDKATRRAAGRAMIKVLPDALSRLERRLRSGPIEQRLKAMQMTGELGVADAVAPLLLQICADPNARLRSKAVALLADIDFMPPDLLMEKALNDADARVRANAVEVLEARHRTEFIPLLTQRARGGDNRERANAIKALARMRVGAAASQLVNMLQDQRPEHRISAMWAMKQIGVWQMLKEVGRLAKEDPHLRVRRYAMNVLRRVADMVRGNEGEGPAKAAG
jgi:HEAT repeat protein